MRSCGLIAAFAAILISHAGASDGNSSESMITFINKTVTALLDFRTACANNVSDMIVKDFVTRKTKAFTVTSSSLLHPVFEDALEAARKEGRSVDKCVNESKPGVDDRRIEHLVELRFCFVEHMPNYADVENRIVEWQKEGKDLEVKIDLNPQCYGKSCGEQCNSSECASLKKATQSWQSKGRRLRKYVRQLNRERKIRTSRCFVASDLEFKKAHYIWNKIAMECIAQSI